MITGYGGMKKTLFTLLGSLFVLTGGASSQDGSSPVSSPAATPPGFGMQASAARNKILAEREMRAALQKAREMKALQYSTAAQPMAPIPWVPEPKPDPAPTQGPAYNAPQPSAPSPPVPPSSPNSAEVEQALMRATNQPSVELPSNGSSGNLFSKLLGKKDRPSSIPDSPAFEAPPSPYEAEAVEMSEPNNVAPPAPEPSSGVAPIFVNRNQGGGSGSSGSVKYEVDIDVNGVDVILPKGSRVTILDERDGFARVRIPDGRMGIVDRSAIE